MAKEKGRTLLIKIGDGASPEVFATLCGLKTKGIAINTNTYDVTTPDCAAPDGPLWRELQDGVRSVTLTGSGYVEGSATEVALHAAAMANSVEKSFQVIWPSVGTFEGTFVITNLSGGGEMEDGVTYEMTLESSGVIGFVAA